jgi:hypothetical protein
MLTTPIGVDAYVEAHVRSIVVGQDRACSVGQQNRLRGRIIRIVPSLAVDVHSLEAVRGIPRRRSAAQNGKGM